MASVDSVNGIHEAWLECARILQAVRSELKMNQQCLPVAAVELPSIVFLRADPGIGRIEAPFFPPAASLSFKPLRKRARSGQAADFVLAPSSDGIHCSSSIVCDALESAASVWASANVSEAPVSREASSQHLSVMYEPSVPLGGVLVRIPVPFSTPDTSCITILRVSVAGCDVALCESPLQVRVGFNHAPAPEGRVWAAAHRGDVPILMRLLEGGASTEETDGVSGLCIVYPILLSVCNIPVMKCATDLLHLNAP
jgi:hypothetical protein